MMEQYTHKDIWPKMVNLLMTMKDGIQEYEQEHSELYLDLKKAFDNMADTYFFMRAQCIKQLTDPEGSITSCYLLKRTEEGNPEDFSLIGFETSFMTAFLDERYQECLKIIELTQKHIEKED